MNFFIDALSAREGGGVTYINNLLSLLPKKQNIKIYILIQKEFKLEILDNRVTVLKKFSMLSNPVIRYLWNIFFLKRLLKKMHITSFFCPGGISILKPPVNCKLIVTFRNMLPFEKNQLKRYPLSFFKIKLYLTKLFILNSLKEADYVIYISKFGKNFIHNNYPYLKHKYVIIPHGIDEKFNKNHKIKKSQFGIKGKYILYVSRLEYYKNQLELVKAFSSFVLKNNSNLKLVLAGPKNTDYGKKIELYIKKNDLDKKVILLGDILHDDLPKLYQNSEINVFLSEVENCPNILLELLSSKKPILCSSNQPMKEFGGKAPFYCNPRNLEEIKACLSEILNNKTLSKNKSLEGYNRSKLYSKKNSIKKTWNFLLNSK